MITNSNGVVKYEKIDKPIILDLFLQIAKIAPTHSYSIPWIFFNPFILSSVGLLFEAQDLDNYWTVSFLFYGSFSSTQGIGVVLVYS